jgi:hypothetical protein
VLHQIAHRVAICSGTEWRVRVKLEGVVRGGSVAPDAARRNDGARS